jgi:NAD(P)-dependent dehydrogenase (short-subunit alcohol dehydrogenase family)
MTDFKAKRIVLTGASRGIGYESAKLFLQGGAEVIGTGRDEIRLMQTARELQALGKFIPVVADLGDAAAPQKLAEAVASHWGAVDILINNAAVQTWKKDWMAEGLPMLNEQWRINVFAQHELIYRLLPMLKAGKEPRVINVSSGAGTRQALQETPDMPTYRLTKYALNGLTMLWAGELKGQVAVNALDPGWLKTDLGGPNAPGEPIDGGRRMLEVCSLPWAQTGKFWHGKEEIRF